ncbi:MAG TPA: FAD-linked oxidase C-terminal domain-containing protein, partial [Acidimicrobiales bacterium]
CLYFTFAGKPEHDVLGLYRASWDAVTRTVLEQGGALSHHHGVGRNRARFVESALGSGYPVLSTLKKAFDPFNIMNPGALGVGGPPW